MVKIYHYTKNETSISNASKVIAQTDRHTHRQTHRHDETITSTAYAGSNNINTVCEIRRPAGYNIDVHVENSIEIRIRKKKIGSALLVILLIRPQELCTL